jgi:DnaK suppressor protein
MNNVKTAESEKRVESIKEALLIRKQELEEQIAALHVEQAPDDTQDIGDQASSASMETLRISLQDAELEEYNMILKALTMIDNGTYGMCADCSQPISEKRLTLYPNATRCLLCQEQLEERMNQL